jgi:hypothetical protein
MGCRCVACVALRAHISGSRINGSTIVWIAGPDVGVPLSPPSYTNFFSEEPNNYFGNESCVEVASNVSPIQWNDNACTNTQGYVVEYESFSAAWPAVDTFVPGGSGSAYQLMSTTRNFAAALALSPAPPLGRMVCWCDAHRSRVRRRLSCNTGDDRGGDWGCRFAVVVSPLTPQRPARVTTRGSQPTPPTRQDRTRGGRGRGWGRRSAAGRRFGPRDSPTVFYRCASTFGQAPVLRVSTGGTTCFVAPLLLVSTSMIPCHVQSTAWGRMWFKDAHV